MPEYPSGTVTFLFTDIRGRQVPAHEQDCLIGLPIPAGIRVGAGMGWSERRERPLGTAASRPR